MVNGIWFDCAAALLAAVSAIYWARSARVDFPHGYDMDQELRDASKKAGRLNAIAAGFAASAAIVPAAKAFGTYLHLVA